MKIDSVIIYRSFVNAMRKIKDPAERCKAYDAMFDYGLDHIETDLDDGAGIALELIKPLLDSQFQKKMVNRENGKKGGRPSGEAVISGEESDVKTENNPKETEKNRKKPKKSLIDNVNDNANVNENIKENTKERLDCSPAFAEALKDYEEMRKKMRKPLTVKAKQMVLKKLESMAPDEETQIAILNQSTMNSWQGIFPLQGQRRKGDMSIDIMSL